MPTEPKTEPQRDVGGIVVAALFILLGCLAWWDTFDYTDADSFVFPRTVASVMIVLCIAVIVYSLIRPITSEQAQPGSIARRAGLVVAMLGAAALMPFLGFLLSGLISYLCILVLAMYDPWTRLRLIVYPLVATAVVVGFHFLFLKVFLVPLPVGSWFQG